MISPPIDMVCLLQTGLRLGFLGAQVMTNSSQSGTKYHISSVAPEADSVPHRHSPTHATDCSTHLAFLKLIMDLVFLQGLIGH